MLNDDGSFISGSNDDILTEENLKRLYQVDVLLVYMDQLKRIPQCRRLRNPSHFSFMFLKLRFVHRFD